MAEHDAEVAADALTAQGLLNCLLRESGAGHAPPVDRWGDHEPISLDLPGGDRLVIDIRRWSPTFRHDLALPAQRVRADGTQQALPLPALVDAVIDATGETGTDGKALRDRVLDSAANTARFLTARANDLDRLWSAAPLGFADTEQALLVGPLTHPTPKSRVEMTLAERDRYDPELNAELPLRWFRVDRSLISEDSATGSPATAILRDLLRADPATDTRALASVLGDEWRAAVLPAHPFEADRIAEDPACADLLRSGLVTDIGTWGSPVRPTTSVRTVHRAGWPWMLKLPLHVRVTSSLRITRPAELARAVETARIVASPVGRRIAEVAPAFVFLLDPAYATVRHAGAVIDAFSVLLRQNRWPAGSATDVSAVTTLCQDWPRPGTPGTSRLGAVVHGLATRMARPVHEIGREWFARFCAVAVSPMLRLYLDVGLCVDAHQQNTLLELEDGWPVRGVYRGSERTFHRQAAHADLAATVPGLGEASSSTLPEARADERLVHHLFVDLTLGVINALGAAGAADEATLLSDLRTMLEGHRRRPGRYPPALLDRLLDDERWPCTANLQSEPVTLPNPLHR